MSNSLRSRRAFIAGGHITKFIGSRHPDFISKRHPDFGIKKNPTLEDYIGEAVNSCLDKTNVPAKAIERAWIGNFAGELFSSQGHLGAAVAGSHPDLLNKPIMRVEGACASGGLAFSSAIESIKAGSDVCLVVGAEVQTTANARVGGEYLARAAHFATQRHIDDFLFPALFARRNKYCFAEFGITAEDLGRLSSKAYTNSNKNPLAHMQAVKMDVGTASVESDMNPCFLGNDEFKKFLKLSDCSQVSDGGSALVVVSEEGRKNLGISLEDCTEVMGLSHATGNLYEYSDPLALHTVQAAANSCYSAAGVTSDQVDVAEVHDCFTITEILMYEALNFASYGEGKELVRDGSTQIDGSIPVNTGGGLVGYGHPVGATGVKQLLEIHRQMKRECGDYQMAKIPEVGIAANMGGDDKTAVVTLLKNC